MSDSESDKDMMDSDDSSAGSSDESCSNNKNTGPIDLKTFFSVKEICYYKQIDKFFQNYNPNSVIQMIDIIESRSPISLRILDWFVTKYSKKRIDCSFNKEDNDIFDVKMCYKSQLKAFKKRYFDPFRRRKKFRYYFENIKNNPVNNVYTTLGQLNFFKWAFANGIILYVDKNLKLISREMNMANKEDKRRKKVDDEGDSGEGDSGEGDSGEDDDVNNDVKTAKKKVADGGEKNEDGKKGKIDTSSINSKKSKESNGSVVSKNKLTKVVKQKPKLRDAVKFKSDESGHTKIILTFD